MSEPVDERKDLLKRMYRKIVALDEIFENEMTKAEEKRKIAAVMGKLLQEYFSVVGSVTGKEVGELDLEALKKKLPKDVVKTFH